mmetsp:Transcript_74808/g.148203  ORF Transcript_74808/g.148203 Transcript_74808/m.148203 type:complete len:219 (+) Transcript_74808:811-1467(+)
MWNTSWESYRSRWYPLHVLPVSWVFLHQWPQPHHAKRLRTKQVALWTCLPCPAKSLCAMPLTLYSKVLFLQALPLSQSWPRFMVVRMGNTESQTGSCTGMRKQRVSQPPRLHGVWSSHYRSCTLCSVPSKPADPKLSALWNCCRIRSIVMHDSLMPWAGPTAVSHLHVPTPRTCFSIAPSWNFFVSSGFLGVMRVVSWLLPKKRICYHWSVSVCGTGV